MGDADRARRIAIATFGRSDFSILRPLCRQLVGSPRFDAGWWVGGAHFEDISGRTVSDVEASGLPIWARIDCGTTDRSPLGTVEMMSAQMQGYARAATESPAPDLVIVLGDRFEAVSAGLAMVPLGIPIGHISGGSITEGAIDDVFRHCLTKVSAVHFCDLPAFAQRINRMGEMPDRIFTTGALGLDALATATIHDFGDFSARFDLDGLRPDYVLTTLHPESAHPELTAPMARATMEALVESGRQVVVTHPNADPGADEVIAEIEAIAEHDGVFSVRGFGADWFPTAMAHARLMVGNSSGGIIEAASYALPVVDIGDRQKGRTHGPNVLHCGRDRPAILAAIAEATSDRFAPQAAAGNIYGDGRGAERVIAALDRLDWEDLRTPKRFHDADVPFDGAVLELP